MSVPIVFVLWKIEVKQLQKQQWSYYKQYIYKNNIISDKNKNGQLENNG